MKIKGYDYLTRKKKVEEILDNTDAVKEVKKFPQNDDDFTYTNGYKAWAGAIFVDLRDSTKLFSQDEVEVAKVIRGFTSEIIEILKKDTDDNLIEIGIRGDCVYAIYSVAFKEDIHDIATRAVYINTYMNMLNKLLEERKLPNIKAGIGLAANKTLAVKAGRKSSGINNLVWIGNAVTHASKLSDLGNIHLVRPIVMSETFYNNYIDEELKKNEHAKNLWEFKKDQNLGGIYHGDVIMIKFNNWINNGMQEPN